MLQSAIVYRYTSPSGKVYIGQTINEKLRKSQHKYAGDPHSAFHKAIKKYGFDSFKYDVLYRGFSSPEELDEFEAFMISVHGCLVPFGYNQSTGGQGHHSVCEETRKKISLAGMGRKHTESTKQLMSIRAKELYEKNPDILKARWVCTPGWKHTPESIAKMSKAKKGKPLRPEHVAKLAAKVRRQPVEQWSLSGEFIKTWPTVKAASEHVKCASTRISAVCAGRRPTCRGFKWKYPK